jgi:hypothetical protein
MTYRIPALVSALTPPTIGIENDECARSIDSSVPARVFADEEGARDKEHAGATARRAESKGDPGKRQACGMSADHHRQSKERRERANKTLPAQPIEARGGRGKPGQQRIREVGEHGGRHVDCFDGLEQAEDEAGKQYAGAERNKTHPCIRTRPPPDVQPRRYESQTDDAAKRQRREHAALSGENELGKHVGYAERDRRGHCRRRVNDKTDGQAERALVGLVPAYAAEAGAATGNEGLLSPRLIGRRQRRRPRRSSGEQLSESQRRLPERSDQLAPQRICVRAIRLDSEGRDLAFGRRNVQGPEHPVPQREAASQILVEMRRIARVVNLMMGRAHEQPAQPSGKCNPDLRMLQVDVNIDEEHEDDVVLREPVLMSGPAQEVLADAACDPGEDRELDRHGCRRDLGPCRGRPRALPRR